MTFLIQTTQRLCETGKVLHWLFCRKASGSEMALPKNPFFSKRQRDHLLLVLRAQWYGFDRNETIYLVQLFDETQRGLHA